MNKTEFVNNYAQAMGISKAEAERQVSCFIDQAKKALIRNGELKIAGFGNFQVSELPPRQVRNPQTGELMQVGKKRVAKWKPGKELKEAVNS